MPMGFNVGATISLGDMETVLDYLNDEDMFKPEIDKLVQAKGARVDTPEAPITTEVEYAEHPESEPDDDVLGLLASDNESKAQMYEEDAADQEEETDEEIEDLLVGIPGMGPRRTPRQEATTQSPVYSPETQDTHDISVEDIYIPGVPKKNCSVTPVKVENTVPDEVEPETEFESEEYEDDLMGLLGGGAEDEDANDEDDNGVEVEAASQPTIAVDPTPLAPSASYALGRKSSSGIKSDTFGGQVKRQVEPPAQGVYPERVEAPAKPVQPKEPRIPGQAPVARPGVPTVNIPRAVPEQRVAQPKRRPVQGQAPKPRTAPVAPDNTLKRYEGMPIHELWGYVQRFMAEHGMKSKPASVKQLESEFGKPNITRLISQSYLISLGGGKVTAGR